MNTYGDATRSEKQRRGKLVIEWAGVKGFLTVIAQHPKVAADCFGASCGAAISFVMAKKRRWQKYVIGFIFSSIATPATCEILRMEPKITTLLLISCILGIFSGFILEFIVSKQNMDMAKEIFFEEVKAQLEKRRAKNGGKHHD